MSTIQDPRVEPVPGSEADPFRYGWRYVTVKRADGRVELEQVPLTLEDLLFPKEGDFEVHYESHDEDCRYLKAVFKSRVADDPMAKVLSDCRVRFDVPGLEPLGPDVAAFFNLSRDWDGGTLEVAETGARPALVVEVTSTETRKNDFGPKKAYYHQAGVTLYIILDTRPGPKGRRVKLHGFRHTPEGYVPLPLDDRGRLWVEPMGIWLAIDGPRVVGIDGRTGEPIGDHVAQVRARTEAEARAEAETRNKDKWRGIAEDETRIRILMEERMAKAEEVSEERARMVATQARVIELSDQISDVLKTKLREAEARIQALEAELRRSRGEG